MGQSQRSLGVFHRGVNLIYICIYIYLYSRPKNLPGVRKKGPLGDFAKTGLVLPT